MCGQRKSRLHTEGLVPGFHLCRDGVNAFARGRNEYVSGGMCEAYPEVQDFWLGWVGECMAAGMDGLDIRISNHSTWSDHMALYGLTNRWQKSTSAATEQTQTVSPVTPSSWQTCGGVF